MEKSNSMLTKLSSLIEKHKLIVYTIGAATLVGSSAGVYYYYLNSSLNDNVKNKNNKKDLKDSSTKKNSNKNKNNNNNNNNKSNKKSNHHNKNHSKNNNLSEIENQAEESLLTLPDFDPTTQDVNSLSDKTKKEYASKFKTVGNKFFSAKKYEKALELYTKAIQLSPDAVFYSNRAACYAYLSDFEKVVQDTTKALEKDNLYSRALQRRAAAYEKLGNYQDSVLDYTAASIIENFTNESINTSIDRVLRKFAENEATRILASRKRTLPSPTFITAYLDSFRPRSLSPKILNATDSNSEDKSQSEPDSNNNNNNNNNKSTSTLGDYYLKLGFEAMKAKSVKGYTEAADYFDKAADEKNSTSFLALAKEMKATFLFLTGDATNALRELNESIALSPSCSAYIKRASLQLELANHEAANADFINAISLDSSNPDVYYHRGQVKFITGDLINAISDYKKSIELDPKFPYSHIQLAVTEYKMGSIENALETFKRTLKLFPNSSDVPNYYGELLMDQGKFDEAVKQFDNALELEKRDKPASMNVLPMVNKALVIIQKGRNLHDAEELCKKALEIDPLCDVAVATISQLLLQQGFAQEALVYFDRQINLARTEPELVQVISYAEATRTQLLIQKKYPSFTEKLEALAAYVNATENKS